MSVARSILLVGGSDTGKSNFLGSLWICLREGNGPYSVEADPDDIEYIESIAQCLWSGKYAPRSEKGGQAHNFEASIGSIDGLVRAKIVVPDVDGELWKSAADTRELPKDWIDRIRNSSAALLFVRVGSTEHVPALDWVASAEYMATPLMRQFGHPDEMPTQVFLTDVLNVLEEHLALDVDADPRVAVIITAWDMLPPERAEEPPEAFLEREYPMVAGRIADEGRLEIGVFGVSATGADLDLDDEKKKFQDDPSRMAYSVVHDGGQTRKDSLLAPIDWALRHDQ